MAQLKACLKAPSSDLDRSLKTRGNDIVNSNIDAEIEISAKIASQLSVPSQKASELASKGSFKWYEPLHLAAAKDASLSAAFFSLGFACLQKGQFLLSPRVLSLRFSCSN